MTEANTSQETEPKEPLLERIEGVVRERFEGAAIPAEVIDRVTHVEMRLVNDAEGLSARVDYTVRDRLSISTKNPNRTGSTGGSKIDSNGHFERDSATFGSVDRLLGDPQTQTTLAVTLDLGEG